MTSLTTAGSLVLQELAGRSSSPHGRPDEEHPRNIPKPLARPAGNRGGVRMSDSSPALRAPRGQVNRRALAALARINDRTRDALAGKQRASGPDNQRG